VTRLPRGLALPIAALIAWETSGRTLFQPTDTLTRPSAMAAALVQAGMDGSLVQATAETLAGAAIGFLIASVLGTAAGIVLGSSRILGGVAGPTVELLRPIPAVALIPLGLLIFGFGVRMEVMTVAFACLWPVMTVASAAVKGIDPRLIEVSRTLEIGRLEQALKFILPSIFPRLFVGLRLAAGVALVVAVTVEIAANPQGLGYRLILAQQNLRPDLAFGLLTWIGCLGWVLNRGLVGVERRYFWRFAPAKRNA